MRSLNMHEDDLIALEHSTVGAPIEIETMAQQVVGRNNILTINLGIEMNR